MKYKAVIFDLDGTLVYTEPEFRYDVVRKTLKDFNKTTTDKIINRIWFEAKRDKIIKEEFKIKPKDFWKNFEKYNIPKLSKKHTFVFEDIGFIDELKEKGFKIAIVTGSPKHLTDFEIDLIGKEKFDAVVRARHSEGIKPKPEPHGIQECLKKLNTKPEEAIFIGNSDEDIESAKNAKVFDIFIDRGEHTFPHVSPSLTINTLHDLRKIVY